MRNMLQGNFFNHLTFRHSFKHPLPVHFLLTKNATQLKFTPTTWRNSPSNADPSTLLNVQVAKMKDMICIPVFGYILHLLCSLNIHLFAKLEFSAEAVGDSSRGRFPSSVYD